LLPLLPLLVEGGVKLSKAPEKYSAPTRHTTMIMAGMIALALILPLGLVGGGGGGV
jgi:membrane-associated phospholipid phosphatase